MAYTDDWESLMNGVFGAGGKLKFGGAQPANAAINAIASIIAAVFFIILSFLLDIFRICLPA